MSHNTFGHLFRVTTFGESHGPALGCVVDGCPPLIPLDAADIQAELDKRRPGQSRFTTQRREPDEVEDPLRRVRRRAHGRAGDDRHADRAADRERRPALEGLFRDHATRTVPATPTTPTTSKYGMRDYRGGGRSSARETAARVAAGAIARKVVPGVSVRGALVQIGPHAIDRAQLGLGRGRPQPVLLPRRRRPPRSTRTTSTASRKAGSSIGAVIEVVAEGVPPGLGAPVYGKLDADLAAALMWINAVKGVEIGDGFAAAALSRRGERRRDAAGQRRHAGVPLQPRRRHPRRHLDRPAGRRALRRQADLVDPDAARDRRRATATRPRSSPRAATIPASASAPCRSARRWWPACSPTTILRHRGQVGDGRWPWPFREASDRCQIQRHRSHRGLRARRDRRRHRRRRPRERGRPHRRGRRSARRRRWRSSSATPAASSARR